MTRCVVVILALINAIIVHLDTHMTIATNPTRNNMLLTAIAVIPITTTARMNLDKLRNVA